MTTSRRHLLQLMGITAAVTVANRAFATPGDLSLSRTPCKVLEIFLRGAASQFSSFWRDGSLGSDTGGTGDSKITATQWATITGTATTPASHSWDTDVIGRAADPLFRPSGTSRTLESHMRVLRVRHELLPHEAALPYTLTGTTLGRTKMSGLGAAIGRRAEQTASTSAIRSLILQTGARANDDLAARYAATFGLHGADFRPPIIKLGNRDFLTALARQDVSAGDVDLSATDALKKIYRDRYKGLLTHGAQVVRSDGWSAYDASFTTIVDQHAALAQILGSQETLLFPATAITTPTYHTDNLTRYGITAALQLLTSASFDMQHIAVLDGGVMNDYDTHQIPASANNGILSVAEIHNGNIWNVCDTLAENTDLILDNDIVVLIHSDFGRIQDGGGSGTEHHTTGYANVVIGNMLTPAFVGDRAGASGEDASHPGDLPGLSPTDVHAAVAQLAGIDPWQNDMFDGDLSCLGAGSDPAAELLGV